MKHLALMSSPLFVGTLVLGNLPLGGVLPGQRPDKRMKQAGNIIGLEKGSQAKPSFRELQSILLLLEEGMEREGWTRLGEFYQRHPQLPRTKLFQRVEAMALQSLLHPKGTKAHPARLARTLLLGLRPAKDNPRRLAINRLAPRAIARLLREEAKKIAHSKDTAEGGSHPSRTKTARPILEMLTRNAADGLARQKSAARRALLEGDIEARKRCYLLALRYPKGPNRHELLSLVKQKGLAAEAVPTIGLGFHSQRPLLHIRAARTLGELGAKEAMPLLAKESFHLAKVLGKLRKAGNGGAGPRANISVIKQQAIVKDFNVEVAQSAAIADPVVGVVSEGAVLDVKVLGVSIIRHILVAKREVDKAYHAIKKGQGAEKG